jgi:hypothetical protein
MSHAFRHEAQAFPDVARRVQRATMGCMGTYCPRSKQAQHRHSGKEPATVEWVGDMRVDVGVVGQGPDRHEKPHKPVLDLIASGQATFYRAP